MNMKNLLSSREFASAGLKEVEFPEALTKLLVYYYSPHVFSADETGLFWKKIPSIFLNSNN
jgi:hypothetical protein